MCISESLFHFRESREKLVKKEPKASPGLKVHGALKARKDLKDPLEKPVKLESLGMMESQGKGGRKANKGI